ncbi:MAG: sugar transferase, partial [Raoultibacter sp.]
MTPQDTASALQGGEPTALDYDNVIEFDGDVFAANTTIKGNPEDVDKAVHDELVFDLESTEKREADPEVTAAAECLQYRWGYRIFKRGMDIVFSGLVLVLFCWLFAIIAIAIKIDDPKGPVLFKQNRVGRTENGEQTTFEMFKFRSMYNGAEEQLHSLKELNEKSGPVFKIKNDPRITRVGRLIRKTSLDELPQFINVFQGSMA